MNVKVQSVKFDADKRLLEFVESKMSKMDKFVENVLAAEVILKVDKDHEHGNKLATIKMELPGIELVVEQRGKTFEEAVDMGIDALKKRIEKHKEKKKS